MDWSTLPNDVLGIIARLLYLQSPDDDFSRFRAVCRSFRSSAPVSTPLRTLTSNLVRHGFSLAKSCIYAVQPLDDKVSNARTWLVNIEESSTGKLQIKDPDGWSLSYPPHTFNGLPKYLNSLDYRVKRITTSYQLMFLGNVKYKTYPSSFCFTTLADLDFDKLLGDVMYKTSSSSFFLTEIDDYDLSRSIFTKVAVSDLESDRFVVMAISDSGLRLFVWRNGDENFCKIDGRRDWNEIRKSHYFWDIVYHNEKFYALYGNSLTIAVDSKSLSITEAADPPQNFKANYLVKSLMDLFLIGKTSDGWGVLKLDEEKRRWVAVMDELEDRVLFVGENFSYSHSARELSIAGNCFYMIGAGCACPYSWFVDLKNDNATMREVSDFPSYSFFWPPPAWLRQQSSSAPPPPPPPPPPGDCVA